MALEKIERRGKFGGVKAHLSGPECTRLLELRKKWKLGDPSWQKGALEFVLDLSKEVKNLLKEYPNLLEDRTPEEVEAALLKDNKKIEEQLSTMKSGKDCKKV